MSSSAAENPEKAGDGRGKSPGSRKSQFQPGQRPPNAKPPAERIEADFDRLKAMRHVLTNPKATDRTEGEKACRVWLDKNPGPFMEAYDRLEAEAKRAQAGERAAGADEEGIESQESDGELAEEIDALIAKLKARGKK